MGLTLILGNIGTGKTILALNTIRSSRKSVIVDPAGEHAHKGHYRTRSLDAFLNVFTENPVLPDPVTVVYDPREDEVESHDYLFAFLRKMDGWTIFIDEVDHFCTPQKIPPEFKRLLNQRRHDQVDLILCARRTAAIHSDLRALASRIQTFHQHEPSDLEYVKKALGKAYSEKCPKLFDNFYLTADFPPSPVKI